MHRITSRLARITSILAGISIIFTTLLTGPAPRALAAAPSSTLFHAEFDAAPLGPLSGPLTVEQGTVVPQAGTVTIANGTSGHALKLEGTAGQATALMQWSNYPGAIPTNSEGTITVRITGNFTTDISTTTSASLSLLAGASTFELFSFGPNGALTRNGSPIGLSYGVTSTVSLDARLIIKHAAGSTAQILLKTASGLKQISVSLPSTFNVTTLNQLQFQLPSGGGNSTADHVIVTFQKGEQRQEKPPVIVIHDSDVEQEIEHIDGVLFVTIRILIVNTGGRSNGTFLVLNLADFGDDFDLSDVGFLDGTGFVKERTPTQIMIGLGDNNVINGGGKVRVQIKFKAKKNELDIKIHAHFTLYFGDQSLVFQPVIVIVPIGGITPIGGTTPISGSTSVSGTTIIIIQRLPLTAIDGRLVGFWRSRGGLDIFGLPLTEAIVLPNGIIVQYFERARLEFHPELDGTRYAVLLGLLGVELGHSSAPAATTPPTSTADLGWYFPETSHVIDKPFRTYWKNRGGLAIFGLPIGDAQMEDGRLVQYFERARFELHPELAGTPYEIQLGQLGLLALQAKGGN
jgi:hypothetical protein